MLFEAPHAGQRIYRSQRFEDLSSSGRRLQARQLRTHDTSHALASAYRMAFQPGADTLDIAVELLSRKQVDRLRCSSVKRNGFVS